MGKQGSPRQRGTDQSSPTDAMTWLSSSMKPGKVRPTQVALVRVVRVATAMAARPIASAAIRTAREARGVVGKLSKRPETLSRVGRESKRVLTSAGGVRGLVADTPGPLPPGGPRARGRR